MFKPGDLIRFKERIVERMLDQPFIYTGSEDRMRAIGFVVGREPSQRSGEFNVIYLVNGSLFSGWEGQYEKVEESV